MSSYECNSVLVTDIQCTNSREWSSLQRKYESQSVWSNTVLKVSKCTTPFHRHYQIHFNYQVCTTPSAIFLTKVLG